METILKSLNIDELGEQVGNKYTIKITSFDNFSRLYNKLEKSTKITKDSDESFMTEDKTKVTYYGDGFSVNLLGDFDDDYYTLELHKEDEEDGDN